MRLSDTAAEVVNQCFPHFSRLSCHLHRWLKWALEYRSRDSLSAGFISLCALKGVLLPDRRLVVAREQVGRIAVNRNAARSA